MKRRKFAVELGERWEDLAVCFNCSPQAVKEGLPPNQPTLSLSDRFVELLVLNDIPLEDIERALRELRLDALVQIITDESGEGSAVSSSLLSLLFASSLFVNSPVSLFVFLEGASHGHRDAGGLNKTRSFRTDFPVVAGTKHSSFFPFCSISSLSSPSTKTTGLSLAEVLKRLQRLDTEALKQFVLEFFASNEEAYHRVKHLTLVEQATEIERVMRMDEKYRNLFEQLHRKYNALGNVVSVSKANC